MFSLLESITMIVHRNILDRVLFLNILIVCQVHSKIIWTQEKLFHTPNSWKNNELPCYLDTIVFPRDFDSSLSLPNSLDIGGIILPRTGAIVIEKTTETRFTQPGMNIRNTYGSISICKSTSNSNFVHFTKPERKYWFDPANWRRSNLLKYEAATPHAQGVPCAGEHIEIQDVGSFSIDLQDIPELKITSLSFQGINITREELQNFMRTDAGQMFFKSASRTRVWYEYSAYCSCHSNVYMDTYQQLLCKTLKTRCKAPNCVSPVRPIGHCCDVCGTMIRIHVDHCGEEYLARIRQSVSDTIEDHGLGGRISFSAQYVNPFEMSIIQLLLVEEADGPQLTPNFANELIKSNELLFGNNKITIESSGESVAYSAYSSWMVTLTTLILVLSFFGIIYNYYISNVNFFVISNWLPSLNRKFRSPFIFARFENNPAEPEALGKVIVNVAFDTESEQQDDEDPSGECSAIAFNNPMFKDDKIAEIGTELTVAASDRGMTDVSLEHPSTSK